MTRVVIEKDGDSFRFTSYQGNELFECWRCPNLMEAATKAVQAFLPVARAFPYEEILSKLRHQSYLNGYYDGWCQAFGSWTFKLNWSQHTFLIGVGPQDKNSLIAITAAHGAILQAPNFGVAYGELE